MISFDGLDYVGAKKSQNSNTSTGTAPSISGETALPLVNSQRKLELRELAKKLGISVEQLEPIVNKNPSFLNINFEEQQKIVSLLDRFDTITNDLSNGLPAEIEARQRQYEYYRDKLLNFKKKES